MRRFITSYTRTLLTRHRGCANILSVLQRISCVFAHRSNARPPAASACAEMDTRSGSTASGETQGQEASKSDQARPHAASQQSSRAHTTPLTRCSTSEVARRQSTPKMVPGLRAQADAWGKVSGAREGPCARLSGECGRLVLTSTRYTPLSCYRGYRRLPHLWAVGDAVHAEGREVAPRCRRPLRRPRPSTRSCTSCSTTSAARCRPRAPRAPQTSEA